MNSPPATSTSLAPIRPLPITRGYMAQTTRALSTLCLKPPSFNFSQPKRGVPSDVFCALLPSTATATFAINCVFLSTYALTYELAASDLLLICVY